MASYVIFEPPCASQPEDAAVFVRDGFHWLAFIVPFIWFLWYRLWIEAGLVFAAMVGLSALEQVDGMQGIVPAISLLLSLGLGFEAPTMRMAALRRRGWRERGVVEADGCDEAAIRYLADADTDMPAPAPYPPSATPAPTTSPRRSGAVPALGLFSYPGRH
ncbi:MAG: DUF2628 domain-containing protein [Rhizobiales bacterium]|nr:DUF2628 domain-containing protein [Hyphomicrobiales bacterium]